MVKPEPLYFGPLNVILAERGFFIYTLVACLLIESSVTMAKQLQIDTPLLNAQGHPRVHFLAALGWVYFSRATISLRSMTAGSKGFNRCRVLYLLELIRNANFARLYGLRCKVRESLKMISLWLF